ncbi:MAG: AI-2E family transporter [Candidatus Saccharimonadales bacterium]
MKRKNGKAVEITIANGTVLRVILLTTLSFLLLISLRRASHAFILIFIAIFLTLAVNTPVHRLAQALPGKKRGNRTLATTISFLIVVLLLAGFVASIAPPLVRQTSSFIAVAPNLVEDVHNQDTSLGSFVRRHHLEGQVDKFAAQLSERLKDVGGKAFSALTRITTSIFSVLTVLVLTFMMLIEGPSWLEIGRRLIPDHKEDHVSQLAGEMYGVVRGYVNGQVLLAALAALVIVIPLFVMNVSYPIALMVIIFICGLIPLVGHTIGAIIVSTVALFHSPIAAVVVLIYYISYQQIENYAIQPRLQASHTNLSPLLVFTSVIIGVSFSGLLGGLLAIPIAGCLKILVLDYLNRKNILEPVKAETK